MNGPEQIFDLQSWLWSLRMNIYLFILAPLWCRFSFVIRERVISVWGRVIYWLHVEIWWCFPSEAFHFKIRSHSAQTAPRGQTSPRGDGDRFIGAHHTWPPIGWRLVTRKIQELSKVSRANRRARVESGAQGMCASSDASEFQPCSSSRNLKREQRVAKCEDHIIRTCDQ